VLVQWKPNELGHNFGDYLSILFERIFAEKTWKQIITDPTEDYYLVGSVIDDYYLKRSQKSERRATFFGCGFRGNALSPAMLRSARVFGVRGPKTRDAVAAAGCSADVVGDPALLLSLVLAKPEETGHTILMPHINDPRRDIHSPEDYGVTFLASPIVKNPTELLQRIDQIAGSGFVLAGAMHGAIVAYAFGRPFAFFDDGHRDCPAKWHDWALSVGLNDSDVVFHTSAEKGREWYDKIKMRLAPVRHAPLLAAAQSIGPLRTSIYIEQGKQDWFRWPNYRSLLRSWR
jgi:hypothetical protein